MLINFMFSSGGSENAEGEKGRSKIILYKDNVTSQYKGMRKDSEELIKRWSVEKKVKQKTTKQSKI